MCCKHGKEGEERDEGGVASRAKRARLKPPQSMSNDDLREELGPRGLSTQGNSGELAARLDEHGEATRQPSQQSCNWRGKVCEFAAHLAVCGCEKVECLCPGCEQRIAWSEVERHMAESAKGILPQPKTF